LIIVKARIRRRRMIAAYFRQQEADMEVNREALLRDMRQVVAQTQALLEAGGDKLGKARESVAEHLEAAKDSLGDLERDLEHGTRRAVRRADHYAQDNPWRVAGAALIVGLVLGTVLGIGAGHRRD
jgi:ElaB/YqjD/DUF883 family membrane-anchored ribosome-binding protein